MQNSITNTRLIGIKLYKLDEYKHYLRVEIKSLRDKIIIGKYLKLRSYMNTHNINEETTIYNEIVNQLRKTQDYKKVTPNVHNRDI